MEDSRNNSNESNTVFIWVREVFRVWVVEDKLFNELWRDSMFDEFDRWNWYKRFRVPESFWKSIEIMLSVLKLSFSIYRDNDLGRD
jgi:hypothetical protein